MPQRHVRHRDAANRNTLCFRDGVYRCIAFRDTLFFGLVDDVQVSGTYGLHGAYCQAQCHSHFDSAEVDVSFTHRCEVFYFLSHIASFIIVNAHISSVAIDNAHGACLRVADALDDSILQDKVRGHMMPLQHYGSAIESELPTGSSWSMMLTQQMQGCRVS